MVKPVWRLHGLNLVPPDKTPHPLIVFLLQDPQQLLGKPDKVHMSGDLEYHKSRDRLDLAAVFYKVYTGRDLKRRQRDYPVFVAWQAAAQPAAGLSRGGTMLTLFIGMGVILLIGFLFLKRYLRQIRGAGQSGFVRYRPLRDRIAQGSAAPDAAGGADAEAQPAEDTDVDPLLKQAAEEYHRERHQEDAADGRS